MVACDYCDHIHVCNYLNNLSGQPWPGAQHEVYCLAAETDGPPYGKHIETSSGRVFVRLDRLFDRRMKCSL